MSLTVAALLAILGAQARPDLEIPPLARRLVLEDPLAGLNITNYPSKKTVTPKPGLVLAAGSLLSVDQGAYANIRLDSIGYARLNSRRAGASQVRGMAFIAYVDPPAATWERRRRENRPWLLEIGLKQGKLMTRRTYHPLDAALGRPDLRVNGFGTNTAAQGTAWSCTASDGKVLDRTDDVFRILVGRGSVDVGGFLPPAEPIDRGRRESEWQYFEARTHEPRVTLQSPFQEGEFKPILVGALQWLAVIGDPLTGPFKVIGPEPVGPEDWPEIVEMLSMGVVRIPTVYLPPRLGDGFRAEGIRIEARDVDRFLEPGEAIRTQFERFEFRSLDSALRGLDVARTPTRPDQIRYIIADNQRRPADLLGQVQLAAQLELAWVEFKNEETHSTVAAERYRQTATVAVDLVIENTFGDPAIRLQIESIAKPTTSRRPVTAAQSLADPRGALHQAVYRAVAEAFWAATDEEQPIRWRGVVKNWSGNSSSGSGTVDVPKTTGLYQGMRLRVLRAAGGDPKNLTVAGTVQVAEVFDASVKIVPAGKATFDRFRPGDIVEEEEGGRR